MRTIFLLRKYIVGQMVLKFMLFSMVASILSFSLDSLANLVFCLVVWFFVQGYIEDKLKFDIQFDGSMYAVRSEYFYNMSSFWGGILFLASLAISCGAYVYADQRVPMFACLLGCMFVVAPFFWIKVIFNFVWSIFKIMLSAFVTVSEIRSVDRDLKSGRESSWGAALRLEGLRVANEAIDPRMDLGLAEEDFRSFADGLDRRVNTYGNGEAFRAMVEHMNEKSAKKANVVTVIIVAVVVILFGAAQFG